jgi:hypothetical protein
LEVFESGSNLMSSMTRPTRTGLFVIMCGNSECTCPVDETYNDRCKECQSYQRIYNEREISSDKMTSHILFFVRVDQNFYIGCLCVSEMSIAVVFLNKHRGVAAVSSQPRWTPMICV